MTCLGLFLDPHVDPNEVFGPACGQGPQDWLRLALVANVQLAAHAQVPAQARQRLWAFHFVGLITALGIQAVGPAAATHVCSLS